MFYSNKIGLNENKYFMKISLLADNFAFAF